MPIGRIKLTGRARGSTSFERRSALYQELDQAFSSYTRFFAAAALTNAVLSRLFCLCGRLSARYSHLLLSELGELLENANRNFAGEIRSAASGSIAIYRGVLCEIRGEIGVALDFADEAHRVRIGLGLIRYIRLQRQLLHPLDTPGPHGF